MKYKYSSFGQKLSASSGIQHLMEDLGAALSSHEGILMMGGGNPALIPEIQAIWRSRIQELLQNSEELDALLGNYAPPNGSPAFIESLVHCLNKKYGWRLTPKNIVITPGAQTAFFYLLNMFAGIFPDGSKKRILLPISPEYIGYADLGLSEPFFKAIKPNIIQIDTYTFKYTVDFDALDLTNDIGAICLSRPTNPTGNMFTESELKNLMFLTQEQQIPLIMDHAYGAPFPNITFVPSQPIWNKNLILILSLSKLGLPGTRTGIVIAHEEITAAITAMNSKVCLANNNLGQCITQPLLQNGDLLRISNDIIKPYYQSRAQQTLTMIQDYFGESIDYSVHKSEGALFLWLWIKGLGYSTDILYKKLKQAGLLIIPGSYFSFGTDKQWHHPHECIRITYSQPEAVVRKGIKLLATELKKETLQ